MSRIPIVLFGLGAIGRAVTRAAAADPSFQVVGAVDSDPRLAGTDLGRLCRWARTPLPRVVSRLDDVPGRGQGRILIHATGSRLRHVAPQIEAALARGYSVVSSCEELAWPWDTQAAAARRLDKRARDGGAAALGTGVNPGFVMDLLPVVLSAVSRRITRVSVTRIVDAATRRLPLQRKIGAGLSPARFRSLTREGELGHMGLPESAWMIAAGLGWSLTRVTSRVRPVIAARSLPGAVPVRAGEVRGLHQVVTGVVGGRGRVRLDLTMALGASPPGDRVELAGSPPLVLQLEGGVPGDPATVAALLNGALRLETAVPGLHTALTLPPARAGRNLHPGLRRR